MDYYNHLKNMREDGKKVICIEYAMMMVKDLQIHPPDEPESTESDLIQNNREIPRQRRKLLRIENRRSEDVAKTHVKAVGD